MAADGFFPQWFQAAYFPSVWFAPGDDEHLTPEERPRPRGMSYEQALAATLAYRRRTAAVEASRASKKRKKKRKARRRREAELLLLGI